MANERQLIDVTDLIDRTKEFCSENEVEWTTNKVLAWIDHAPTVDAIIPVRCKDCTWRDVEDDCLNPKCGKSWYGCPVPDEHYCSYGERRCE